MKLPFGFPKKTPQQLSKESYTFKNELYQELLEKYPKEYA